MPTWRADYFECANGKTLERSIFITADNEALAFEKVRAAIWDQLVGAQR